MVPAQTTERKAMLKDGIPRVKIRRHIYYHYPSVSLPRGRHAWDYKWAVWWDDEYAPADGSPPTFARTYHRWSDAMNYAAKEVW